MSTYDSMEERAAAELARRSRMDKTPPKPKESEKPTDRKPIIRRPIRPTVLK